MNINRSVLLLLIIILCFRTNIAKPFPKRNVMTLVISTQNFIFSLEEDKIPHLRKYKFSHLWLVQSGVGVIGMLMNGGVLHFFYNERKALFSSVNSMLV